VIRIRFLPQADAEVAAETRYYRREAGSEVSKRFVQSVEQATQLAREFPRAGSPGPENTRRLQLKGFPFALIYRLEGDEIVVFALAHNARHPEYWLRRNTPR
jgi:plasmid stabilization system protein ParE